MSKRKIFISHSSKDFEFANQLCTVFEQNDLPCWIAPRDIPYGTMWSEEITRAIEQSRLMIFIFSEHSNKTAQTIREINLAEQQQIPIIAVKLTDVEYNRALKYYMSIYQWVTMNLEANESEMCAFADNIKSFLDGACEELAPEFGGDFEISDINIDDELNAKFGELFSDDTDDERLIRFEQQEVPPFRKKLLRRIESKFLKEIFVPTGSEASDEIPKELAEEDDGTKEDTEARGDRFFSMEEKEGRTAVFLVRKLLNEHDYTYYYTTEQLEKAQVESENGVHVEYTVHRPDREGNPLVTITFLDCDMAIVNMGYVDGDVVKLANQPMAMPFRTITDGEPRLVHYSIYPQNGVLIMDPETAEVVPRKQYYDCKKRKTVHYIDLITYKKYFAFEIRKQRRDGTSEDEADRSNIASSKFIADAYYYGDHGLKKNIVKAAEWYEKSGNAESMLRLSEIFTDDPLLSDPEDAAYYYERYLEAKAVE